MSRAHELAETVRMTHKYSPEGAQALSELERLAGEAERLREALTYIADTDHPLRPTAEGMRKRARAALGAAAPRCSA